MEVKGVIVSFRCQRDLCAPAPRACRGRAPPDCSPGAPPPAPPPPTPRAHPVAGSVGDPWACPAGLPPRTQLVVAPVAAASVARPPPRDSLPLTPRGPRRRRRPRRQDPAPVRSHRH